MEMNTEVYNAWSLVLQLMVWVAMIATFLVYFRQLRAMQRGAIGQNILSVVNYLQAPYVREARTIVRENLRGRHFSDWSDPEKRAAALVCSTYDVAAILIFQQELVPSEPFVSNWGPSIKDCYEILREYIAEMQKPENSGPAYWNDFGMLYQAVVEHATAQQDAPPKRSYRRDR